METRELLTSGKGIEASVIRAFWGVFGYGFVGFISLIYGIMLQIHNYGKEEYIKLFSENMEFKLIYIVMLFITTLYNLLFCHSYASLYVEKTNIDKHLYPKLGHWLETILVIVILSYFIPLFMFCNNKLYTILTISVVSMPWCFCIIFYRTLLVLLKKQVKRTHGRIKYKLIIPTVLLIAVNIYTGSCLTEMLQGGTVYYITFLPLCFFLIIYCFADYFMFKKRIEESALEKKIPYVYYIILILCAGISVYMKHYWNTDFFNVPIRSLFLASFVAVYLAMFEGWFLLKNIEVADENGKKIGGVVRKILECMPMVVFLFFPFQQFQIIYLIFFVVGHIVAWSYWNYYEKLKEKKPRQLSVVRGVLGSVTLLALILDKWYPLDISKYIGVVLNVEFVSNADFLGLFLTVVQTILGVVSLCLQKEEKKIQISNRRPFIYLALIAVLFAMLLLLKFKAGGELRVLLAMLGCIIFAAFECYSIYKERRRK